jgi:hypothetical protein
MPLHGLRWFAGAAVVAGCVAGACGYPNFTYAPGSGGASSNASSSSTPTSSSTGPAQGGGGSGGATTSTVSSTVSSTASSSSTGSSMGQVKCADGADLCLPGQVCCYNELGDPHDPTCDKCSDTTTCEDNRIECQQAPYDVYECDNDADCGGTMHCCAQIISGEIVQEVRCYSHACSDQTQTRQMCHSDNDCPGQYPTCSDFMYPPYQVCE